MIHRAHERHGHGVSWLARPSTGSGGEDRTPIEGIKNLRLSIRRRPNNTAGVEGIEPTLTASETAAKPLGDTPTKWTQRESNPLIPVFAGYGKLQ